MSSATNSEGRPVGPFALLALGVNGIVGVGIFFVPATLGRLTPGRAGIAVFALTALALVPVALVFATLGRRFDEDGGPVLFARAAFGELFSFLVGWLAYVSAILSASAVMFGLASALAPVLGFQAPLPFRVACAVLVTGLCLVVASGISISAFTWTALTVLKLLPLVALVAVFVVAGPSLGALAAPPGASDPPLWARAILTALFACQGFEIVPVIAGQVRASQRAVPFATVGSLLLACLLYVGLMWTCVATLPLLAASRGTPRRCGNRVGRRVVRRRDRHRHVHLRPGHLPGHDGHDPAVSVGAGLGRPARVRPRPFRCERRAHAGARGDLVPGDGDGPGR